MIVANGAERSGYLPLIGLLLKGGEWACHLYLLSFSITKPVYSTFWGAKICRQNTDSKDSVYSIASIVFERLNYITSFKNRLREMWCDKRKIGVLPPKCQAAPPSTSSIFRTFIQQLAPPDVTDVAHNSNTYFQKVGMPRKSESTRVFTTEELTFADGFARTVEMEYCEGSFHDYEALCLCNTLLDNKGAAGDSLSHNIMSQDVRHKHLMRHELCVGAERRENRASIRGVKTVSKPSAHRLGLGRYGTRWLRDDATSSRRCAVSTFRKTPSQEYGLVIA